MLKWSYKYCPSAKYTLKADDDMFVNIEYLLKVLKLRNLNNTDLSDRFLYESKKSS
jgi:hypothetical protein